MSDQLPLPWSRPQSRRFHNECRAQRLTRNLGRMQVNTINDILYAIDDAMGLDTECWK